MACAKTCVLLCHCCCKDYTELFYLLTARSVYPYNFCMSYSVCVCEREREFYIWLTLSLSAHTGLVCVLLFCARLHVQISTTISSSMAMKVATLSLSVCPTCCLFSVRSRTHHRLFGFVVCVYAIN